MRFFRKLLSYLHKFLDFLIDLIRSRGIILELTRHDFKQEYLGSYFGIVWAFLNPLVTLAVLWFVFEKGFRSAPVENFPFILWLICGLFPWQFISSGINYCMNSIIGSPFLVKKIVFRVSILPIIKINSLLIIHSFFIIMICFLFILYGHFPTLYWLQIPYFLFCSIVLLLGMGWMTSSIIIFFRDLNGIISIILQFGFWLTPIFWNPKVLPQNYLIAMKLNPVYYIIEGYRDSFINQIWFWEHGKWSLYFWIINLIIFVSGGIVFKKLRPHFADVL